MKAIDAILSRQSIRKYLDAEVSDAKVEMLMRAAMAAPSAGNAQVWKFIVVRDPELLTAIPDIHPHARMAPAAKLAIVVCADPTLERYPGFWPQDVSAATQNILLAAHADGLGAVWCGIYPNEERMQAFRELLNIPEQIMPFSIIPMGYPDEGKALSQRYDAGRVCLNRWG